MKYHTYRRRVMHLEGRVQETAPDPPPERPSRLANDPQGRALICQRSQAIAEHRFSDAHQLLLQIALRLRELDQIQTTNQPQECPT